MNNQSDKFYFNNPDIWESLRGHSLIKEVMFIGSFLPDKKGLKILDIGCGSGMHSSKLQELGHEVIGIDLNEHMVSYAREKYPKCQFLQMSMLDIGELKDGFDAIICLCTTLCYVTDNQKLDDFFANVYKLLNPNGVFIFDVFNPIAYLEKLLFDGNYFGEDREGYTESGLKLTVKHDIDEATQILTETKCVAKGDDEPSRNITKFRMFFPQELRYMVKGHGFTDIDQYGKYISDYKKLDSTRIVTVCRKPGDESE
jgi:SAM-dependent methyltransferase